MATKNPLDPGALRGVRYTVFGCGNRDWASTFQAIPRLIEDELTAANRYLVEVWTAT